MFGTDYLELIAVPKGATSGRIDLLNYPFGLNGLVFGSEDSTITFNELSKAGVVPYGRVYYCHHFTRDLVWRDEWRHHDNGVVAVVRALIVEPDPAGGARLYADMFGDEAVRDIKDGKRVVIGNSRFDIVTEAALKAEFGDAAPDAQGRTAYMAGLTLRTLSLPKAAHALEDGKIAGVIEKANRLVVPAKQALNAVLEFVE